MENILIKIVHFYQRFISPAFPPTCRYYPTCSTYMIRAITKHGSLKGTLMGTARILRCHPLSKGGFDPVPDYFSLRRNHGEDYTVAEREAMIMEHQIHSQSHQPPKSK